MVPKPWGNTWAWSRAWGVDVGLVVGPSVEGGGVADGATEWVGVGSDTGCVEVGSAAGVGAGLAGRAVCTGDEVGVGQVWALPQGVSPSARIDSGFLPGPVPWR